MIENYQQLDHSYVYTTDKVFFCAGGNLHSQESVFGMPYYFPTKDLEQIMDIQIDDVQVMNGTDYTKLLSVIPRTSYPDFIRDNYPDYYYSPEMWQILMKVNRDKIIRFINPKERVQKLLRYMDNGHYTDENPLLYTLDQMRQRDASLLQNVGLSGSSLLKDDILSPGNDIDLVFYRRSTVLKAKDFSVAMRQGNPRFRSLDGEELKRYVDQRVATLGGTTESVYRLVKDRWDVLYVDGVKLDFSFVDDAVVPPLTTYETRQEPKPIKLKANITDVEQSYYMPTVLGIDNEEIEKVILTRRGYICLFANDQPVEITGKKYSNSNSKKGIILVDDFNGGSVAPL